MARNPRAEMPFLDHLEELRWRLLWSALAVVLGSGLGFFLVLRFGVLGLLLDPLNTVVADLAQDDAAYAALAASQKLNFTSLTEPFFLIIKLSVVTGIVTASPIIAYHVWGFLTPALEDRERKAIIPSFTFGMVLFAAGVLMAYFTVLPISIRFLIGFGSDYFTPLLTGAPYLAFVTRLLLAFGIVFELPVVILVLSVMGLISAAFLRAKRRHAIVAITVLASFLSPGDIIVVTIMMMIPLILLYELGIMLATMVERRRAKDEREAESHDPTDLEAPVGSEPKE